MVLLFMQTTCLPFLLDVWLYRRRVHIGHPLIKVLILCQIVCSKVAGPIAGVSYEVLMGWDWGGDIALWLLVVTVYIHFFHCLLADVQYQFCRHNDERLPMQFVLLCHPDWLRRGSREAIDTWGF